MIDRDGARTVPLGVDDDRDVDHARERDSERKLDEREREREIAGRKDALRGEEPRSSRGERVGGRLERLF